MISQEDQSDQPGFYFLAGFAKMIIGFILFLDYEKILAKSKKSF